MKLLYDIIGAQSTTINSQQETIEAQNTKISELESKINFEKVIITSELESLEITSMMKSEKDTFKHRLLHRDLFQLKIQMKKVEKMKLNKRKQNFLRR